MITKEQAIEWARKAGFDQWQSEILFAENFQALAQLAFDAGAKSAVGEPVAWRHRYGNGWQVNTLQQAADDVPLYTTTHPAPQTNAEPAPPAEKREPLTDIQLVDILEVELTTYGSEHFSLCRAVEQAHGIGVKE